VAADIKRLEDEAKAKGTKFKKDQTFGEPKFLENIEK